MNVGKAFVKTDKVWKQKVSEVTEMMRKKHRVSVKRQTELNSPSVTRSGWIDGRNLAA